MTLIYEYDSPVFGCDSKTTVEAHPLNTSGAIEVFEKFLKGAGFDFDGSISLKNITEPNNCCGGCDCVSSSHISDFIYTSPNVDFSTAEFNPPYNTVDGFSAPDSIDTITISPIDIPEIRIDLGESQPKTKKKRK